MKKASMRRCVVCRKSARKDLLLRFVFDGQGLRWDEHKKLPGRGAYVHRDRECLLKIASSKMWQIAFRLEKTIELEASIRQVMLELEKAGELVVGDASKEAEKKNRKRVVRL